MTRIVCLEAVWQEIVVREEYRRTDGVSAKRKQSLRCALASLCVVDETSHSEERLHQPLWGDGDCVQCRVPPPGCSLPATYQSDVATVLYPNGQHMYLGSSMLFS